MRGFRFRFTTRTLMLAVLFAAAVTMHLQYVHFEDRWEDYRQRAERAANIERMNRQGAQFWAAQARLCTRDYSSMGEYLDALQHGLEEIDQGDIAPPLTKGDRYKAPPPSARLLQLQARRFSARAQASLDAAQAYAREARSYRQRWW
jgi:hypothetical protein